MMGGYGYGYGPMMYGGSLVGFVLMVLFWLVVAAGFVALVVWLVRSGARHGAAPGAGSQTVAPHDEAMATARRRLAAGEITPDQFEEIRRALDAG